MLTKEDVAFAGLEVHEARYHQGEVAPVAISGLQAPNPKALRFSFANSPNNQIQQQCIEWAKSKQVTKDSGGFVMKQEKPNRIEILLSNGYKLVAEQNSDPNFSREMFIGIEDSNGAWCQDLAIVRSSYHYEGDEVIWNDEQFDVDVFGDETGEDFTEMFPIRMRPQDD